MMPSWLGYVEARRRLDERFGNPFVLGQCYLKRLEKWPSISRDDVKQLDDFRTFLIGCRNAMTATESISQRTGSGWILYLRRLRWVLQIATRVVHPIRTESSLRLEQWQKRVPKHQHLMQPLCRSLRVCFVSCHIHLGVCGKRTTINLTILNADSVPTSCFAVSNLEVCGFTESVFVTLPVVFSQESMPVSRDQVPSQEDLNRWTYLSHIAVPALDAEVGILIGNNVPKATEPWEVVNSLGDGPYEVRFLLGWSVNGSLRYVSVEDGQCPLVSSWWVVRSRC